jgi:hypothetical protein
MEQEAKLALKETCAADGVWGSSCIGHYNYHPLYLAEFREPCGLDKSPAISGTFHTI